ncbi:MAG: LOG family protein, partial [Betaproteobacteria bacterium]
QLGIHNKPVGILNIDGYYDALLTFLNQMVGCGFLDAVFLEQLYVDTDSERLIQKLREYTPTKTKPTGVR